MVDYWGDATLVFDLAHVKKNVCVDVSYCY